MIVMVPGEPSDWEPSHDATGFTEEVVQGIQALNVEFSTEVYTVGIISLPSHRHSGGQLSVEFPGTLPVIVGEVTTEFHDAKIKGEGAFGEGWHDFSPSVLISTIVSR
jgi:hypothetical protein